MKRLYDLLHAVFHGRTSSRNAALVLSGGGARGFAHIGAIEVLQERGYHIRSIAGTSMGALVGGLFAAGKLHELKERVLTLDKRQVISMIDLSLGLDYIASGDGLMRIIDELIGEEQIEQLPVRFCCCATDLVSGQETVFRTGSLQTAIRCSISIPGLFKPVKVKGHIYVDGSVHNTLPLDRVAREPHDLLVAVNVSAPDRDPYTVWQRQAAVRTDTEKSIRSLLPSLKTGLSENYLNMGLRVARLTVQNNTRMAMRLTPPDICAEVPMNQFGLLDFDKGAEIIRFGREEMTRKIDEYEAAR